jgi:ribonuclease T1
VYAKVLKDWVLLLAMVLLAFNVFAKGPAPIGVVALNDLPHEAQKTITLIRQDGPFPYAKDGATFRNYEGVLPKRKHGYYHEFTVKTVGKRNRSARRVVVGGEPRTSREYYYTDNHYATFKRIKE